MLNTILRFLTAPRRLRSAEDFLESWCPKGVEVVNDGHQCWLHYGGMIYSLRYTEPPSSTHIPYMREHLENHKWCMELVGGVYTHRILLEAWVKKYLPDGYVIGASSHDIVYPDETRDRPLLKGAHSQFIVTHNCHFVIHTNIDTPLPTLVYSIMQKTSDLKAGKDIYFYPPPRHL